MANRSISVILRAEVDQYKRAMSEAGKATEEVGKKSSETGKRSQQSSQQAYDGWSKVATPLIAVGGAITAMGAATLKTGIAYNQLQQQSRAALTTLLGSAEAANAQMDRLDAFARTSPFSKQTFITAQQQMLAFGIEAQKVVPYLDAIQDAVAAAGGGSQQVGEIAFIMSQISSASKITAQDLMQFGQRGVNAAELIGSRMGKTGAQIRADITAGTLGADEALDALAAGMEARFDGAAANVKNTFSGALDRVSAAWRDLSASMAEPLVGKEGGGLAVGGLNAFADALRDLERAPDLLKLVAGGFVGLSGTALLASGTLMTIIPRIAATNAAVENMGRGAQFAWGSAKNLTKGIGIAAGAFVAYEIALRSGVFATKSVTASTDDLIRALTGLDSFVGGTGAALDEFFTATGASAQSWRGSLMGQFTGNWASKEIGGLDDALKVLNQGSLREFIDGFDTAFGVFGDSRSALALGQIEKFDEAITKLFTTGNAAEAKKAVDEFTDAAQRQGMSIEEIDKLLPSYNAALTDADRAARNAAAGAGSLADALGVGVEDIENQSAALIDYAGAAKDAEGSLKNFIKDLEDQAAAAGRFTDNLIKARERGLDEGFIKDMMNLGPAAGGKLLDEAVNATDRWVERTNAAYDSASAAVSNYKLELAGVSDAVITTVMLDDAAQSEREQIRKELTAIDETTASPTVNVEDNATGPLSRIKSYLNTLQGGVMVRVHGQQQLADGGLIKARANGGLDVYGRSVPRIPQIRQAAEGAVLWGEPETGWEAYISGKAGMEARNREIWVQAGERLGMLNRFAAGGSLSASYVASGRSGGSTRPASFTGTLVLDSGEFMGKVSGVAIQAAESTSANVQRFDRSQASTWR